MKELSEELKKQFTCLKDNTEKYITFTVSIKRIKIFLKEFTELN